jgi:protocatechuate 3,4-dioxygenase beta subunit
MTWQNRGRTAEVAGRRQFLLCLLTACGCLPFMRARAQADVVPKFTPPPGEETSASTKLIDAADAALQSGKATTDILANPVYLPVHEGPRFRKLIRQFARSSRTTLVCPKEPGDPLIVTGRVLDQTGQPMREAVLYLYQTSAKGWYSDRAAHISAREGDRRHARLFGYLITDVKGRFEVHTIRPAGYPDSNLPAHIHIEIARTKDPGSFTTEIQFEDDPRLTPEMRKRSQQEGFVIAPVQKRGDSVQQVRVDLKVR